MKIKSLFAVLIAAVSIAGAAQAQGYDGLIADKPASSVSRVTPQDGYGGVVSWPGSASSSTDTSQDLYGYIKSGSTSKAGQDSRIAKLKENLEKRKAAQRASVRNENMARQAAIIKAEEERKRKEAEAAQQKQNGGYRQ